MKNTIIAFAAFSLFFSFSGCKKTDQEKKADSLATKFAKFELSVFKDSSMDRKSWLVTLAKGESVELISEETVKINNKDVKISKVKLLDNSIGYIQSDNLAVKTIVFIEKNVKVYNRPGIDTGDFATITIGTVAFVTDEKADWYKIDIGKVGEKYVIGKWVKGGISDNIELIADAVSLEKQRGILSDAVKGNKDDALAKLKALAEKSNPIGELAKEELLKFENGTSEKPKQDTPPAAG